MNLQEKLSHQKLSLVKATEKLNQFYQTTFTSEKLQILGPLIKWEAHLTAAANIDQGLRPLFLGLKQLFSGEESSFPSSQLIGPQLKRVINNLSHYLAETIWEPKMNEANKQFFKELITFSIFASSVLGTMISKKNALITSTKKEGIHHLTYQFNLLIISNSTLLSRIYKSFLKLCGANSSSQQVIGEILALGSWFLMVLAALAHNPKEASSLIETIKSPAIKSLETTEQLLSLSEGHSRDLLVLIQKCKKSFEEEDLNGIIESIEIAVEFNGGSLDHLRKELATFYKVTEFLDETLTQSSDDKTNTATRVSVVV